MKPVLSSRLKAFRTKTKATWASISKETGISITTLSNCEKGKFSSLTMETIAAFLDCKEASARRWQNLDDPEGKIELYVDPAFKSGTIVKHLNKPYLVMEPVTEVYQSTDFIKGSIPMPDDKLEPVFAKGSPVGLHWIKNIKLMKMDHYYMIVDNSLNIYMGITCPVWPVTTIEFRPANKKYPSFYIHEPNIKAVFGMRRPWSVILNEIGKTVQTNND